MYRAEARPHKADRIAGLIAARGVSVANVGDVHVAGHTYRDLEVDCRDNEEAIAILNDLARDDALNGEKVRAFARRLWTWAQDAAKRADLAPSTVPELFARKVHKIVRDVIEYEDDPEQVFRSSDVTLTLGVGNCVNTARLAVALARAVGLDARAVGVVPRDDGEITHACAQIAHDGAWHWAEATIAADYGEPPLDAARRLGILRDDLGKAKKRASSSSPTPCCAACAESSRTT